MKTIRRIILAFGIIMLIIILTACENPFLSTDDDVFFHISRKNANMPVWIRGNSDSKIYLVILYGGPGGSSTGYWGTDAFELLEKEYRVVYWDQRSSGFSTGTSSKAEMTPEEVALDTDLLINVINKLYSPADIFLYGHSWGGLVGTTYLKNSQRQAKITGWIEVAGAHNWPLGMELSYNYMRNHADKKTQAAESSPDEKKKWSKILTWYDKNPLNTWNTTIPSAWSKHVEYVWEAYGYVSEEFCDSTIDKISSSIIHVHDLMNYTPTWSWFTLMPKVWEYDASPGMENITLPTKLIWGINDGILPKELAQDAYDRLGTSPANKSITILPNSAQGCLKLDC